MLEKVTILRLRDKGVGDKLSFLENKRTPRIPPEVGQPQVPGDKSVKSGANYKSVFRKMLRKKTMTSNNFSLPG